MKKLLMLTVVSFLFSIQSKADDAKRINTAECTALGGSYFRLNVSENRLEANFAKLGKMANEVEGERMKIEVQFDKDLNAYLVGALVLNSEDGSWGSAHILVEAGQVLSNEVELTVLFLNTQGENQQEKLSCQLTFK